MIVLDCGGVDAGLLGSSNCLKTFNRGARGFVMSSGVRDTDELILQKIPVWTSMISQGMVQGRLQFESMDVTVCVGGVQVNPGDIIVADGDGVIVVPLEMAQKVGEKARSMNAEDRAERGEEYRKAGWELDSTVD